MSCTTYTARHHSFIKKNLLEMLAYLVEHLQNKLFTIQGFTVQSTAPGQRGKDSIMDQRLSSQQMVLEQLDINIQVNESTYCLCIFTKTNSKWGIDLNVKQTAIKLLEDNRGKSRYNLG